MAADPLMNQASHGMTEPLKSWKEAAALNTSKTVYQHYKPTTELQKVLQDTATYPKDAISAAKK